jgi:cysteinyl-tRNA synthetase
MSEVNLKIPFDIHGGGQDLLFPHHENEIAQSCASINSDNPEEYAKYWMHNGFVTINGEKMSKSLNNIILLNDLLKEHDGETIRLALLSSQYRKSLDWNKNLVKQAEVLLKRAYDFLDNYDGDDSKGDLIGNIPEHLSNDLDTPKAITSINELLKNKSSYDDASIKKSLIYAGNILGIFCKKPSEWSKQNNIDEKEANEIEKLIHKRNVLKKAKDFEGADAIRDLLHSKGIELIDSQEGTTWKLKS